MSGRPVAPGQKVEVFLSPDQVELIRKHTFADPSLLAASQLEEGYLVFRWSLDEVEDVQGHVPFEANHTENRRLGNKLDKVYVALQEVLDTYDDHEGP